MMLINSYRNKLVLITSGYSNTEPFSQTGCNHISDSDAFVETETKYIRTSNFGAELERSYIFGDLRLKTFLRCS